MMADSVVRSLPGLKTGSLVVFGDVFGGRIDNIHQVISAEALGDPERLAVTFHEGETLEIWDRRVASGGSGSTTDVRRPLKISSSSSTRSEMVRSPP